MMQNPDNIVWIIVKGYSCRRHCHISYNVTSQKVSSKYACNCLNIAPTVQKPEKSTDFFWIRVMDYDFINSGQFEW